MANEAVTMVTTTLSTLLLVLIALTLSCHGQQLFFVEGPQNTSVHEGQTAVMRCIIGRQQGFAIWRINEIFLTLERLPFFPRYKVIDNEESGEHFLRIENATIKDDAEYECQVVYHGTQKKIQARAHLTVLIPPASVHIQEREPGERIQTKEKEEIVLQCVVIKAKPAAEIVWFKRNLEIKFAANENEVEEQGTSKRFNTRSKMTIQVQADDNDADYTCEARHPALIAPKCASITFDVIYPPGPQEISFVLIAVLTAGFMLLLLSVIIITYYCVRRRTKKGIEKAMLREERLQRRARTEMFVLSTCNQTANGETLSPISKESESYSQHSIFGDRHQDPLQTDYCWL